MALVRVKRRPHEDPIDVLLLACKKRKTEDSSFSKVFKFAATVEEKDKDLDTHVSNLKEALNLEVKDPLHKKRQVADITEKLRAENKLFSKNNRLKVINCFRHGENGGDEAEVTVVDIENHPQEITNEVSKDSHSLEGLQPSTKEQYVYDLYYSHEKEDFDDLMMENMLSAHSVDEMLFDFSGEGGADDEVNMDDEDDSNDENNWRNDYPDEISEDEESVDDGDMMLAMQMKNVNLDGEYESDLSSDREDEALIYGNDYRGHYYYCPSDKESSDSD